MHACVHACGWCACHKCSCVCVHAVRTPVRNCVHVRNYTWAHACSGIAVVAVFFVLTLHARLLVTPSPTSHELPALPRAPTALIPRAPTALITCADSANSCPHSSSEWTTVVVGLFEETRPSSSAAWPSAEDRLSVELPRDGQFTDEASLEPQPSSAALARARAWIRWSSAA